MKGFITKLIVVILLFGAFGAYIFFNLPEILTTLNTTTNALTSKMIIALIVGIFSYSLVVVNFQRIFSMFDINKSFKEMLKLDLSALATGVVIPSFGISGSLVFIDDATKKHYSKAKAFAATILYIFTDYTAISVLLILNLLIFSVTGFLKPQVLIPVVLFLLLTAMCFYLIFLASSRKSKARALIIRFAKPISKIYKRLIKNSVDPKRVAEKVLNEFSLIAKIVKKDSSHYVRSLLVALSMHAMRILSLYLVFVALGFMIQPHVLLSGYVVGMVLVVISPTPNGIGFVEGGMLLIFTSLGVPSAIAGTATIIYRGFQFWIPFFIGLFFMQHNQIKSLKEDIEILSEEAAS